MSFPLLPSSHLKSEEPVNLTAVALESARLLAKFYGTTPENFTNYLIAKDLRERGVPLSSPEHQAWFDDVTTEIARRDAEVEAMREPEPS